MANKAWIPALVVGAAVAALFVPYKVDVDKDEDNRIKKITTKSLAVGLSYTPARDGEESDLRATVPGISASKYKVKAGKKTYSVNKEQLASNAKAVYGDVKKIAKKAADGVFNVVEDEEEELVITDDFEEESLAY